MQMLNTKKNLVEEFAGLRVSYTLWFDNTVKELTSVCMLHDQVELSLSLNNLVELYHIWMPYLLQNFDFPSNPVNICLILDFGFF